ncbi:MAG: hypothetical protein WBB67_04745 [bacterium]
MKKYREKHAKIMGDIAGPNWTRVHAVAYIPLHLVRFRAKVTNGWSIVLSI